MEGISLPFPASCAHLGADTLVLLFYTTDCSSAWRFAFAFGVSQKRGSINQRLQPAFYIRGFLGDIVFFVFLIAQGAVFCGIFWRVPFFPFFDLPYIPHYPVAVRILTSSNVPVQRFVNGI